MRKSRVFAAAVVTALFFAACEAPQYEQETETVLDTTAAEEFSMSNKIGATLRQALRGTADSLTILVRVDTTAAPDAAEQLTAAGLKVQTKAGDVYTARGPAAAVREAAELPAVQSLQLSETREE